MIYGPRIISVRYASIRKLSNEFYTDNNYSHISSQFFHDRLDIKDCSDSGGTAFDQSDVWIIQEWTIIDLFLYSYTKYDFQSFYDIFQ